jgi:hypothetical protein
MRNAIVNSLCAGALWLLLDPPAGRAQSSAIAPLVSTGVSAAMSLSSMANSLAAQQRAAALQQQQFEAQQQAQHRATELQQIEQQRALSAYQPRRKCPTGYHHATVLFSDGSKHRLCVEEEQ